jgi:hypothetical protein
MNKNIAPTVSTFPLLFPVFPRGLIGRCFRDGCISLKVVVVAVVVAITGSSVARLTIHVSWALAGGSPARGPVPVALALCKRFLVQVAGL